MRSKCYVDWIWSTPKITLVFLARTMVLWFPKERIAHAKYMTMQSYDLIICYPTLNSVWDHIDLYNSCSLKDCKLTLLYISFFPSYLLFLYLFIMCFIVTEYHLSCKSKISTCICTLLLDWCTVVLSSALLLL